MSAVSNIAFHGEHGSESHDACRDFFPLSHPTSNATIGHMFEAVKSGACEHGLLWIDDTVLDQRSAAYRLLPTSGLRVVGERFRPLQHNLIARAGTQLADVRTIIAEPSAAWQCLGTIRRLKARLELVESSSSSARKLAETFEPAIAIIGTSLSAAINGLSIISRGVEDIPSRLARYLIMSDTSPPLPLPIACITSFTFRVRRNMPAALYKALGGFATNGVNVTRLESYTEGNARAPNCFYTEAQGQPEEPALSRALDELRFFCEKLEILGTYPADPLRSA